MGYHFAASATHAPDQDAMDDLPKFSAPPVVEAVLGVQFAPLPISNAQLGWYWQRLGLTEWPNAQEVMPVKDAFERFGDEETWTTRGAVEISEAPAQLRLQISHADQERMIQAQWTRFICNWRRAHGEYPSFEKLLPEFNNRFDEFSEFLESIGAGAPSINQWEVTYVNHVPLGSLWRDPSEWVSISDAFRDPIGLSSQPVERFRQEWRYMIGDRVGRLHVAAHHGRVGGADGEQVVSLQLTARGPIATRSALNAAFVAGHAHIVRSFAQMTTESAHKAWRRTR